MGSGKWVKYCREKRRGRDAATGGEMLEEKAVVLKEGVAYIQ